ncbi:MAG TPA: YHS domain-containing protein, partial [Bacteroidetes bacterium]|nr:YHS domain-containing protein [Bacteroidota bacterium]HEX05388.1 YHS domain-containing protein [Bacteroidota bacterium]
MMITKDQTLKNKRSRGTAPELQMVRDPVCDMEIQISDAVQTEIGETTYYFCSEGCRDLFQHDQSQDGFRPSYDMIIVGGGPAGLTAAVYAAQLRMNAFLVSSDLGGQAIDSTKVKNYMGFDFITGPELVEKFKDQLVHSNYIDHHIGTVDRIEQTQYGFGVYLSDGTSFRTSTVLLATGMTRRHLNIPGAEKFQRNGVFYGSIHDISTVQGKDVVVVGGGNSALQSVEKLLPSARLIHVVSDLELTADSSIIERVNNSNRVYLHEGYKVSRIEGTDSVERIIIRELESGQESSLAVNGVFVNIGLQPNSSLVAKMAKLNEKGEVIIGPDCSTKQAGLYAAGDVTNAFGKRIVIASGEGAKAASAIKQYVHDIKRRVSSSKRGSSS